MMSEPMSVPTLRRTGAAAGFTLIELMVAVAIVGILAAVAIPMYSTYVQRSRLVSATNQLAAARSTMEQYYQDNRTYMATGTFTPACSTASTVTDTFTVSCVGAGAPTASTYTITALGSGVTAGFSYSINQVGAMSTTFGSIWGGATVNGCWLVKRATSC
jgi:type IV pilus assembly protein PilE